jgi:CubicO group peptidase (beta-lactamase class C family)|tara:strand:- start:11 stop:1159 length:1149 start_codon:yes stop_codon:yes gene_type:complete
MKKFLFLTVLSVFLISNAYAKHQYEEYSFNAFWKYEVKGSDNYYQFQSNLVKDKAVIKEIKNKNKTGLVSYLLFENDKIIIDEHDLPSYIKNNNGLLPSHSVGKSLVSYVTGYAICEGYIDSVDVTLDDWLVLNGTLYEGQKLIDLLNMRAGDQKIIGEKNFNSDNRIKDQRDFNVNVYPIKKVMKSEILQNTKKSSSVYNYNALATNIIMNYTIFKVGDDYQKLLNKVFKEDAKIKNSVFFSKTIRSRYANQKKGEYGRYSFYADRYDYLRIAKAIMDHWNNDTCVGKYLKTVYDRRISKNKKNYDGDRSGQFVVAGYTRKYGGQFHFDIVGISKRKILGMDGFGGQQIIIDFDKERIIVVNSRDRHYNWKKIVLKKLKQK